MLGSWNHRLTFFPGDSCLCKDDLPKVSMTLGLAFFFYWSAWELEKVMAKGKEAQGSKREAMCGRPGVDIMQSNP